MSYEITIAPVIVHASGATATERKLSVVYGTTSKDALMAIAGQGGKVGKAAAAICIDEAHAGIVAQCCHANFRPIAEYIAATLGEPIVISGRGTFEALPDMFEQRIMKIKASKTRGVKLGADGVEVATPKLALELRMKSFVEKAIKVVAEFHAAKKAEREAAKLGA